MITIFGERRCAYGSRSRDDTGLGLSESPDHTFCLTDKKEYILSSLATELFDPALVNPVSSSGRQ